jgi:hypothetical protein
MSLLAESKFEREASAYRAKSAPDVYRVARAETSKPRDPKPANTTFANSLRSNWSDIRCRGRRFGHLGKSGRGGGLPIGAGITAAVLYLLIVRSFGFYQAADILSSRRNGSRILWQWLLTSLLLAVLAFLFRIGIEFSRGSIICFAGVALAALSASRSLMKATLIWAVGQGRAQGRRVVVVGLRDELAAVGKVDLLRRFGLTEVERVAFPNKRELVAYGEQRYANVSGPSPGSCA